MNYNANTMTEQDVAELQSSLWPNCGRSYSEWTDDQLLRKRALYEYEELHKDPNDNWTPCCDEDEYIEYVHKKHKRQLYEEIARRGL